LILGTCATLFELIYSIRNFYSNSRWV